ncbi:GMC oxidoreductase [Macrolepiota fuliginosa MF-IS2]|uniref:GMC oxidoreductase n=1 Tax=Macrolepiota fuliginosa MF-IS2 TaxID=1400762 RepID=A0A9P6BX39_9AGAR|nr:GMC oxidoreductase [Macrolepiota fuliginosa MF-IS2]
MLLVCCICSFLSFAQAIFCAVQFQRPDDLPGVGYDFIVVGGGNAGTVVVVRLNENPDFKILIIEAGPLNKDISESQVPGLLTDIGIFGTHVNWNYTTTPRAHTNGGWASVTGDDNLSWDKIFLYILKAETWSGLNIASLSEEGHYDPSVHGLKGAVNFSAPYYMHPLYDLQPISISWNQNTIGHGVRSSSATAYLDHTDNNVHVLFNTHAMRTLPTSGVDFHTIKFTTSSDAKELILSGGVINTPQILLNSGIGPRDELQALGIGSLIDNPSVGKNFSDQPANTIGHGVRSSSATAYLDHTDNNVHVLLNTRATRTLPTSGVDFRTIEFTTSSDVKELILLGGVINTPQILLNSGIGPRDKLQALGISSLIDNPSIGKNFSDQPAVLTPFPTNLPVDKYGFLQSLNDSTHIGSISLIKPLPSLNGANPFKDGSTDPTGGPNLPQIKFFFQSVSGSVGNVSIQVRIITLATSLPFDAPIINLNFLADPLDTAILLEGVRSVQRLFSSPSFNRSVFGFSIPDLDLGETLSDKIIIDFIKNSTSSSYAAPLWTKIKSPVQTPGMRNHTPH